MKILHIIANLNRGGAENVLTNLIKYHEGSTEFNHSLVVLQKTGVLGDLLDKKIKIYELNK
jgi:hypothetical protein